MTVSASQTLSKSYTGDGTTYEFEGATTPDTLASVEDMELIVSVDGVICQENAEPTMPAPGYEVVWDGRTPKVKFGKTETINDGGQYVEQFNQFPIPAGCRVVVALHPPFSQSLDLLNGQGFFPHSIETALDSIVLCVKYLQECALTSPNGDKDWAASILNEISGVFSAATAALSASTVALAASTAALEASTAAQEAAASIPAFPTPSAQDNNKVITVSGGTFALSNTVKVNGATVSNNPWDNTGLTLYSGTVCIYGSGANRTLIKDGEIQLAGSGIMPAKIDSTTLEIGTVTNGTFSIPFSVPIVASTASTLTLTGDNAYSWNLTASTSSNTLDTDNMRYNGVERLWAVDIALGASASVQYGLSMDSTHSDALTASKLNHCVVRFNGTTSTLYCYGTEDLT